MAPPCPPLLTLDSSESHLKLFEERWRQHKSFYELEGQSAIDELWTYASPSLAKACYEFGASSDTNEEELLEVMKQLSLKCDLANSVQFLTLFQETEEPVTSLLED